MEQSSSYRYNEIEVAKAIQEFVLENLNHRFSHKELARRFGVEISFIKNKLPQILTHTLAEILHERRMDLAKKLLRDGVKVESIATQVGYKSASQFIKAFRKDFGSAPYTWLKKK